MRLGQMGFVSIGLVSCFIAADPTFACRSPEDQTPLLHESIPILPKGAVSMNVEVVRVETSSPAGRVVVARIISMLHGSYSGKTVRIEPRVFSSCDGWPTPGTKAIAAGYVLSSTHKALTIDPIRAPSPRQMRGIAKLDTLLRPIEPISR